MFTTIFHNSLSTLLTQFLRLFFHFLYHNFANIYDLIANVVSLGKWYEWIGYTMNFLTGQRILELGHGTGHLQALLLTQKYDCFGIDESYQMGKLAIRRIRAINKIPHLIRCRAEFIPFMNSDFDNIVSTFPSEYIFHLETASESYRVLVPGGKLIILLAAKITGTSLHERILSWIYKITSQVPPDNQDLSIYSAIFSNVGFKTYIEWKKMKKFDLLFLFADK